MRKELKDLLKSDEMVLCLPRDFSKDVISQWMQCRNILRPPINFILSWFAKAIPNSRWTSAYYRFFLGMKIGKRVGFAQINPDFIMPELIEIGDDSTLGWKVTLATHEFTKDKQRFGRIIIGKNVLVGGLSVIRSGVRIGNNSVIIPMSFVFCDVPPNEVWGGNPAKKIRSKLEEGHTLVDPALEETNLHSRFN